MELITLWRANDIYMCKYIYIYIYNLNDLFDTIEYYESDFVDQI